MDPTTLDLIVEALENGQKCAEACISAGYPGYNTYRTRITEALRLAKEERGGVGCHKCGCVHQPPECQ